MTEPKPTDDELKGTEQPFVQHLFELRDRLLKAIYGIAIIFLVLVFFPGPSALYDFLAMPLVRSLPEGSKMIAVGVVSIVAAWTYTGGPSPYGYLGFGELFVFVFFGVVATLGTTYAVSERVEAIDVVSSCVVGALAVGLLIVNNLRDIPTDAQAGKKTLAVRIGDRMTRWVYCAVIVLSAVGVASLASQRPWSGIALAGYVFAYSPVSRVVRGARGAELIPVLGGTARVQLVVGLLLAFGLVAS